MAIKLFAKELSERMKIRIQKSLDIGIRMRHSINVPKDNKNTGKN